MALTNPYATPTTRTAGTIANPLLDVTRSLGRPATPANYTPSRIGAYDPGGLPAVPDWIHPDYQGTDPAYQAWLANADLRGKNAMSDAKLRKAQAAESYRQAIEDAAYQATNGRRTIQGNMLGRGILRSGETGRRQTEFDSAIEQAKARALTAEQDQFGSIDATQRNTLANIGMEATTQVSQAMLRDQLAAYNAQQAAAASAVSAAPAAPSYTPAPPAAPVPAAKTNYAAPTYVQPTQNQAGLDPRYRVPAPPKPPVVKSPISKLVVRGLS